MMVNISVNVLATKCMVHHENGIINSLFLNPFPFQPFLLEIELLYSRGDAVFKELTSLPGVETRKRASSPVIPLLLSSQPPVPSILKPLKDPLCDVSTSPHLIWITDVSFVWWRDIWRGWRENMHIFSYMII